jgi:hypothetical protein
MCVNALIWGLTDLGNKNTSEKRTNVVIVFVDANTTANNTTSVRTV